MDTEQVYFDELAATAERYMGRLGAAAPALADTGLADESWNRRLHEYTAFVEVHGAVEGGFVLSVQADLAFELTRGFLIGPVSSEESVEFAVDAIAEIANVIGGNALSEREEQDVRLGRPVMYVSRRADIRAQSPRLLRRHYRCASGDWMCLFVPSGGGTGPTGVVVIDNPVQE